ncbi:hypothetical protein ISALK_08110 [Isachenkonia alkalipeptolytica]|uniref:Fis family transcriptional regulator n=1 Tax=Isachenkonia alkalipeptolytica TaxID=2565777 RepID=A0AA43XLK1_9CLOT|nr:hypothetical protein [Isachenkonia alkalipeptolytica]
MEVENTLGAKQGQRVLVEIEYPKISSSAFYVYIIPLVAMIIGVLVGLRVGQNIGYEAFAEIISVVTGLIFLVLSYLLLSLLDKRRKNNLQEESRIQMKEIIKEKEE